MRISDWSSDVCSSDLVELAVDAHQMLVRPLAAGVVGVRDVVRGGELPAAAFAQQEGVDLGVVVEDAGHEVEGHAAEDLGVRGFDKLEMLRSEEKLVVGEIGSESCRERGCT